MEILRLIVLALHFVGMAAIVGVFLVQLRQDKGFSVGLMLGGAVTQVITGAALVGLAEAADRDVNYMKIGFKLAIALIVLVATVVVAYRQRKNQNAKPFFHTAGGLALVNVLVAVLWR